MSESKKLNRLSVNKETITDLDVPQEQEVVGGQKSVPLAATCFPPTVTNSPAKCIVQHDRKTNNTQHVTCHL